MFVLTAGCAPAVRLDTSGVQPRVDYSDLGKILHAAVDENGLLVPELLDDVSDNIDAQAKLLAVTGPTATPELFKTRADKLAYWYNARTLWAIELSRLNEFPKRLWPAEYHLRVFPLDGRQLSLEKIDKILSADSDWRTVVAAPDVAHERAVLPTEPFTAEDVEERILKRFSDFIDDDRRFIIDVDNKQIIIPPEMWQFRDMLIRRYNEKYHTEGADFITALLPYLEGSPLRRLQDAIGYQCVRRQKTWLHSLLKEE